MASYTGNPITNPDEMAFEVDVAFASAVEEIVIDTTNRTIALKVIGTMTPDGATEKAIYSKIKDAWRSDATLIKFPFPFTPITDEQFELRNGWSWDKTNSSSLTVTASDILFTAPNTITTGGAVSFASFTEGDLIDVTGSGSNNSTFTIVSASATDIVVAEAIVTEAAGSAITITSQTAQTTEELVRTGGWSVEDANGIEIERFMNVISLGALGATDQVYYVQGEGYVPLDFILTGTVNQAVRLYATTGSLTDLAVTANNTITSASADFTTFKVGDYISLSGFTDPANAATNVFRIATVTATSITTEETTLVVEGPVTGAVTLDYSRYFKLFVREWYKVYAQSEFEDIGVDTTPTGGATFQAYRFPLTNSTDVNLTVAESAIAAGGGMPDTAPYNTVSLTYLRNINGGALNIIGDIQPSTPYLIGDVVFDTNDGNWYEVVADHTSQADLVANPPSGDGNYTLFTGQRDIGGVFYPFTVIIDGDTASGANGNNDLTTIYEAIQYRLRLDENYDIDDGTGAVIGKTADELLTFIGDTLVASQGVFIDSYRAVDTNNIEMNTWDGTGSTITKTFPYVAALTIGFGQNLIDDANAKYWVFFENAGGNLYGTTNAIIVQDASPVPQDMAGNVSGNSSVNHSFAYTTNVQGGRTPDTDANIVAVGIGLTTGQYVNATGVIAKSVSNTVQLVAALERNYSQGTIFP